MSDPTIHGTVAAGFEAVRDAFAANFSNGDESGASVALTHRGVPVVDIWAGQAKPDGTPWAEDTIVNVYSTTKTMAALCVLMLADRGEIDLDAPVATYWPGFERNGKEGVLVSHVMSHTAGLSGFETPRTPEQLYDWDATVEQLAAQATWWEPGTQAVYHAVTQGFLQGELVRQITGRTLGTFFREEVATPLGADFHIGLPESEDHRVAELVPPPQGLDQAATEGADPLAVRTLLSSPMDATEPRTRAWRAAEIPAAGGTGNARAVARVHSAMACGGEVDGVRLLSEAGVARVLDEQYFGPDAGLGVNMRYGMGFGLTNPELPISPNERAFFWGGWGGSLAVIDLDSQMSFAYVMNRMAPSLVGDTRAAGILMAAHMAVAEQG